MVRHEGGRWDVGMKDAAVYVERVSDSDERVFEDSLTAEEARKIAGLLTKYADKLDEQRDSDKAKESDESEESEESDKAEESDESEEPDESEESDESEKSDRPEDSEESDKADKSSD
ncbi:hypothetical protein [Mycobacterium sp.]|uniref:hypothetical protein n=1 Tax=Mycobacterium sp. TaxID=1785 RepID=UPI00260E1B07|nr:hypothetical protein [Mycobacterium sp.]